MPTRLRSLPSRYKALNCLHDLAGSSSHSSLMQAVRSRSLLWNLCCKKSVSSADFLLQRNDKIKMLHFCVFSMARGKKKRAMYLDYSNYIQGSCIRMQVSCTAIQSTKHVFGIAKLPDPYETEYSQILRQVQSPGKKNTKSCPFQCFSLPHHMYSTSCSHNQQDRDYKECSLCF